MFSYGLAILASQLFWTVVTQADVFIASRSLDAHQLGLYTPPGSTARGGELSAGVDRVWSGVADVVFSSRAAPVYGAWGER